MRVHIVGRSVVAMAVGFMLATFADDFYRAGLTGEAAFLGVPGILLTLWSGIELAIESVRADRLVAK